MLARMTVSPKHVFTHVPKSKLLALLVFLALDVGTLNLLHVERCGLYNYVGNWKYLADVLYDGHVSVDFVLYRRGEPSFIFGRDSIIEAWLTMTKPIPAGSSLLSACR